VGPYVTDELFERRKFSYNASPEDPSSNDKKVTLAPLPALFKSGITAESVARLGFLDWPAVERIMRTGGECRQTVSYLGIPWEDLPNNTP
jgi:hypothetical protein